jgi:glycosyltransferase involved in cell wall biosynthesis
MATWIEALLARGHQVVLFTLAPGLTEPRTFRGDRLTIHIGRYRLRHRARDFFAVERKDLIKAMTEDRCDILHAHWTNEFSLAALATGFPTLVTVHDPALRVLRHNLTPYWFVRTIMVWEVARRATYMTAVSDDVAKHFRRYFCYTRHLSVIGNAVAESIFRLKGSVIRRPDHLVTFATVLSGWSGLKNNQTALRAFHKLREVLPQTRLIMFGDQQGPGEAAESWARANGLDEGIQFAGMVPYATLMQRLAAEVDVLLHPSFVEALSMAVAEGLALGLPVIAGEHTGGMQYLLENGRSGVLVDVGSDSAVADAMFRLASDAELRTKLGRAAYESATRRFSADTVMSAYEKEYERVLKNWPPDTSCMCATAGGE